MAEKYLFEVMGEKNRLFFISLQIKILFCSERKV